MSVSQIIMRLRTQNCDALSMNADSRYSRYGSPKRPVLNEATMYVTRLHLPDARTETALRLHSQSVLNVMRRHGDSNFGYIGGDTCSINAEAVRSFQSSTKPRLLRTKGLFCWTVRSCQPPR